MILCYYQYNLSDKISMRTTMNKKTEITITHKTSGSKTMALDAFHALMSENFRQSLWAEGIKYEKSSWQRVDRRMLAKKSGRKRLATLHK